MEPVRLALVNDYELVVRGLAALVDGDDRFVVVDLSVDDEVDRTADIALYDTFGAGDPALARVETLLADEHVARVAIYTATFDPSLVQRATEMGVAGVLSKALPADQLKDALVNIHRGETVFSESPDPRSTMPSGRRWPGQSLHLTEKEADVLALITQGFDNRSIAETLFISPNTLKTRVRNLYRKIGVDNRVQAALWGVRNGFEPDNDLSWF